MAPVETTPTAELPNPIRPKVKAAGGGTVLAAVLVYVLRLVGVDVDQIPPEVLVAVGGALATGAAVLKKDGLKGAWQRVANGSG